jgi:pyrroline-5-carboxylate reductase
MFRELGGVVEVDESLLDAVTAVSGSGPAWFFRFVEALEKAAVDLGLSPQDAATLVRSTAAGAGQMMQGEDAPSTLRERVTTPGGTTAAGLDVFDQVLDGLAQEALRAARDRGAELGRQ